MKTEDRKKFADGLRSILTVMDPAITNVEFIWDYGSLGKKMLLKMALIHRSGKTQYIDLCDQEELRDAASLIIAQSSREKQPIRSKRRST